MIVALPTQAQAQTPTPAQKLDRVEVTGSLIKRVESEMATPVTVIRVDELEKAGVTNAEQALQYIAQNQSGTTSTSSVGASNGGASYANLRSLGSSRTLVLVNGQRVVNNPYSAESVDLNAIPLVGLERVEVLADGASATYGTDAIAGVVNFILRKEYQGIGVSADVQLPQGAGGKLYTASIGGGWGSLEQQGFNIYGGFNYRKQDPLAAKDRSFAKSALIEDKGIYKVSPTTFPANYSQSATGTFANPTQPKCKPPYSLPLADDTEFCYFDYVPYINIIPEQEQWSGILRGTLALGQNNTLALDYFRTENTLTSIIAPTPLTGLSMLPGSPYYPGGAGFPGTVPATLDKTKPISVGWRTIDAGPRSSEFNNVTDRASLGLNGNGAGWDYQATALYSSSTVKNSFVNGYVNNQAIRNGINGVNNAPFLNPFGDQTAAGTSYILANKILGQVQEHTGRTTGVNATAGREVWQIDGRPVQLAMSTEYRKEEAEYTNNFALIRQAASSGLAGTEDISGDRNVWALGAELNIPVLKNLDVGLAVRYDDYSDVGGTTNPKISLRFQPIEQLLLRGSYNTGFRAPSLYDLYSPNSTTFTGSRYNDPQLCPDGVVNAAAGGVKTRDCKIQFYRQAGGNKSLQPETADAWTVGMVFQPAKSVSMGIDYWNYSLKDSLSVLGEQTIFGNTTKYASKFVRCSTLPASQRAQLDPCLIPGGDPLAYIVDTTQNLGGIKTDGLDLTFQWQSAATDAGRFNFGVRGTYVLSYKYQLEPNGEWIDNLGNYSNGSPVFRYQQVTTLGWQKGPWSTLLINQFKTGYEDANAEGGVDPEYYNRVGAYSLWNLSGTYAGIKGLALTLGVQNLFNQDPKFSNQSDRFQVGYDDRYSNPMGRTYMLRAAYEFK
ncbi:MAG: TonB-dependent receptor [Burkholderiaceae bacterium]